MRPVAPRRMTVVGVFEEQEDARLAVDAPRRARATLDLEMPAS